MLAATEFLSVVVGGRFSFSQLSAARVVVIDDVADSCCINKLSAVHLLLSLIVDRLFDAVAVAVVAPVAVVAVAVGGVVGGVAVVM